MKPSSASSLSVAAVLRLALPLVAMAVALLLLGDLARHLEVALALLAAGFVGLAWAARRLERAETAGRLAATTLTTGLLAGALLLRLPLLPLAPTLSDDLLRYVWDGRVVLAGENPYTLAPEAEQLAPLRDERWRRMPHKEVPSVYPPLAQALFAAGAATPAPELALKLLLTAADLAGCWLLLGLARRLGVPASRAAWYAWNPLVALEVAGMGHVDALGAALAVAAVAALVAGRSGRAGLAAAGGILTKLAPLAALPAWARRSRRPGRFLLLALGITAAATLPLAWAVGGVPPGLLTYGVSWEFNGPVYEPLWHLLDGAGAADAVKGGLDRVKEWIGHHEAVNRLYPWVYPQLLAKLILLPGMLAVVALSLRGRGAAAASGRLFGGLLLLSATVYPWYLLWVLPWAALARQRAWLALSALILLSYLPQHRELPLLPWVFVSIWLPFFALLFVFRGDRWSAIG